MGWAAQVQRAARDGEASADFPGIRSDAGRCGGGNRGSRRWLAASPRPTDGRVGGIGDAEMAGKNELMALGLPYALANRLGVDSTASFVAAGASQGNAVSLTGSFFTFSTAPASTGGII